LRIVLPHRWQTTENMDAGNVKRVVMLGALEGRVREVAKSRGRRSAMISRASTWDPVPRQQSFVLFPRRKYSHEETKVRIWFNHFRTSIAFRTNHGPPNLRRLRHCIALHALHVLAALPCVSPCLVLRLNDERPAHGPDIDVKASDRCVLAAPDQALRSAPRSLAHDVSAILECRRRL
jgi:hypothetical protein